MARRARVRSLGEILGTVYAEVAEEIGLKAQKPDPAAQRPLWEPLELLPGRPGVLSDGRRVSPQQAAVESLADELFFGGSPGSGKSIILIGLALTRHRNSIIFRREYTQLTGAEGLMAKAEEIVGPADKLNQNAKMFPNLPGGRKLEFGATGNLMSDWLKWAGRSHDFKGFDELPEIAERAYRLLIAWLRTAHIGQRTRVVSTGNPPLTAEGEWVIRYWAPWLDPKHPNPAKFGELRWFVTDDDDRDIEVPGPRWPSSIQDRPDPVVFGGRPSCRHQTQQPLQKCPRCGGRIARPRSRTFIGSTVEDNPAYLKTGYGDVLANLTGQFRALGEGNFQATVQDHPRQLIPTAWILAAQNRWKPNGALGRRLSQVGVDPSWGGEDEFVIAKRYGAWVAEPEAHRAKEAKTGPEGAQLVALSVDAKDTLIQIDADSQGASVKDWLVSGLGYRRVVALHGGNGSQRTDSSGELEFVNERAEWAWLFRELLDPSKGHDLALPPDPRVRADLAALRFEKTIRGIKVESKEEIKKRLGRSPDRGEAVIYASVEAYIEPEPERMSGAVW